MLEIKRIDLRPGSDLELYKPFVIPTAFPLLEKPNPETLLVVLEAREKGKLVGVAIAEASTWNVLGGILSLFVKESRRRHGIGTALFKAAQENLLQAGSKILSIEFLSDSPSAVAIEKILKKFDWPIPAVYLVRCHFIAAEFNPPWIQRRYPRLPKEIKVFPWNKLKEGERSQIQFQLRQSRIPAVYSPFKEENLIEPLNSFGLRKKGEIIGWIINHRIDASTIRYSNLYIDSEFHHTGYAIYMLIRSMQCQKRSSVPLALFEINIRKTEPSWWHFVQRRLIPHAERTEMIKISTRGFDG